MNTLSLINSNLKRFNLSEDVAVSVEKRDRLFYDRFEYVIGLTHQAMSVINRWSGKVPTESDIKKRLRTLSMMVSRSLMRPKEDDIFKNPEKVVKDLQKLSNIFEEYSDNLYTISGSRALIYTNDLSIISALNAGHFQKKITDIRQADVSMPRKSIFRKKSNYKHRIYFRSVTLSIDQVETAATFFKNYGDEIKLSPSMHYFLYHNPYWNSRGAVSIHSNSITRRSPRTTSSFFVDINDRKIETFIDLILPGARRATYDIITE